MNKKTKRKVAILAIDGFEESELMEPREALEKANIEAHIVSPNSGSIKSWADGDWGQSVSVDKNLSEVTAKDYNALMLPGGVINPDKLRKDDDAITFVKSFFSMGKPVGAICHAPQILIEAEEVANREMTSFASIKTDLENAGANWLNKEVVVDSGLVTSRNPNDLPAFNAKFIEVINEGE